ncbi:MAG: Minf_1886 family protein [Isosphaerales bacterium]
MSFRDELVRIIASDPRYTIDAYAFILEALNHARTQKLKGKSRDRDQERSSQPSKASRSSASQSKTPRGTGHVTGRELCETVRRLALRQFGLLAATVLGHWGVRSTSDIGEIVYNLIAAGDLEKTPSDSRSDFDNVFDFETALKPKTMLATDDLPH